MTSEVGRPPWVPESEATYKLILWADGTDCRATDFKPEINFDLKLLSLHHFIDVYIDCIKNDVYIDEFNVNINVIV